MKCTSCGNPDSADFFCSLCGAELSSAQPISRPTAPGSDPLRSEKSSSILGWLAVGFLAAIGWFAYMNTPIWGQATPFYILGLRESDFGGGDVSRLGRYQTQIAFLTLVFLSLAAFSFYKALNRTKK